MIRVGRALAVASFLFASCAHTPRRVAPYTDYHFHLLSPAGAAVLKTQGVEMAPIDAAAAVAALDRAGIRRAVILSDAYFFKSYDELKAENDWTAREVSRFPDRLVAFCGVNPLADDALAEIDRCARNRVFRGLKLHFDESHVDLLDPVHVAKVRRVFEAANRHRFPVITHIGADVQPPYGPRHARVFVDELLSAAPDVTVLVAHLWGGAAWSDEVMGVFAEAARTHPNLYFEISGDALRVARGSEQASAIARRMREIGMRRFLFGSDFPVLGGAAYESVWPAYMQNMPLTAQELRTIAANEAPFLRR
ncbi:MAG TPA: amidohydrolase family protein [Thermoanaerobaculia bacterium]|jgi:predicted TIM-barrel fold metal-dependent hydrolase